MGRISGLSHVGVFVRDLEEMTKFYIGENAKFKTFADECINRFKWLLKKYGMNASLPDEDELHKISPDPFTGELNEDDAAEH